MEKMADLLIQSMKEEQHNRTCETRDNKAFLALQSYVLHLLEG